MVALRGALALVQAIGVFALLIGIILMVLAYNNAQLGA